MIRAVRRALALTLTAALAAVLLAGCSDDGPERANNAADVKPAVTTEPSAADVPAGSGKTLSKKRTKAALLTEGDLPTGWDAEKKVEDSRTTTEPAQCAAVFNALDKAASPVSKAQIRFSQGPQLVTHSIVSFKKDTEGLVADTGEAFSKCSTFTSIDASGTRSEAKLSPLPFPNLGDRTLAVRVSAAGDGENVVSDVILIAVGHNVIGLFATGPLPVPASTLTAMARRSVAKLA